MNDHAAYVRKLRASISDEGLRAARASLAKRRRKKTAKSLGKTLAALSGIGLGVAGLVSFAKAGKRTP